MDVNMPVMDGLTATKIIKSKIASLPSINYRYKIVIVTAFSDQ